MNMKKYLALMLIMVVVVSSVSVFAQAAVTVGCIGTVLEKFVKRNINGDACYGYPNSNSDLTEVQDYLKDQKSMMHSENLCTAYLKKIANIDGELKTSSFLTDANLETNKKIATLYFKWIYTLSLDFNLELNGVKMQQDGAGLVLQYKNSDEKFEKINKDAFSGPLKKLIKKIKIDDNYRLLFTYLNGNEQQVNSIGADSTGTKVCGTLFIGSSELDAKDCVVLGSDKVTLSGDSSLKFGSRAFTIESGASIVLGDDEKIISLNSKSITDKGNGVTFLGANLKVNGDGSLKIESKSVKSANAFFEAQLEGKTNGAVNAAYLPDGVIKKIEVTGLNYDTSYYNWVTDKKLKFEMVANHPGAINFDIQNGGIKGIIVDSIGASVDGLEIGGKNLLGEGSVPEFKYKLSSNDNGKTVTLMNKDTLLKKTIDDNNQILTSGLQSKQMAVNFPGTDTLDLSKVKAQYDGSSKGAALYFTEDFSEAVMIGKDSRFDQVRSGKGTNGRFTYVLPKDNVIAHIKNPVSAILDNSDPSASKSFSTPSIAVFTDGSKGKDNAFIYAFEPNWKRGAAGAVWDVGSAAVGGVWEFIAGSSLDQSPEQTKLTAIVVSSNGISVPCSSGAPNAKVALINSLDFGNLPAPQCKEVTDNENLNPLTYNADDFGLDIKVAESAEREKAALSKKIEVKVNSKEESTKDKKAKKASDKKSDRATPPRRTDGISVGGKVFTNTELQDPTTNAEALALLKAEAAKEQKLQDIQTKTETYTQERNALNEKLGGQISDIERVQANGRIGELNKLISDLETEQTKVAEIDITKATAALGPGTDITQPAGQRTPAQVKAYKKHKMKQYLTYGAILAGAYMLYNDKQKEKKAAAAANNQAKALQAQVDMMKTSQQITQVQAAQSQVIQDITKDATYFRVPKEKYAVLMEKFTQIQYPIRSATFSKQTMTLKVLHLVDGRVLTRGITLTNNQFLEFVEQEILVLDEKME